jgi:hypothetical protein
MALGDFDLAALKRQSRQTLHGVMAVLASYTDSVTPPTDIHVRWHNTLILRGKPIGVGASGEFGAEILEGIDRIVFQESELTSLGITIASGGYVTIYGYDNARFKLEAELQPDGPENIYFQVSHMPQSLQPGDE